MQLLDDMLALNLLTPDQHHEIGTWVRRHKTPDQIMRMPPNLWIALERASLLLDLEIDATHPH